MGGYLEGPREKQGNDIYVERTAESTQFIPSPGFNENGHRIEGGWYNIEPNQNEEIEE